MRLAIVLRLVLLSGGASYGYPFPSEAAMEAWVRSFLK